MIQAFNANSRKTIFESLKTECISAGMSPEASEQRAERICKIGVFLFAPLPTLFTSLMVNKFRFRQMVSSDEYERMIKLTGGFKLLGLIDWIGHDNCILYLDEAIKLQGQALKALQTQGGVSSAFKEFAEAALEHPSKKPRVYEFAQLKEEIGVRLESFVENKFHELKMSELSQREDDIINAMERVSACSYIQTNW